MIFTTNHESYLDSNASRMFFTKVGICKLQYLEGLGTQNLNYVGNDKIHCSLFPCLLQLS